MRQFLVKHIQILITTLIAVILSLAIMAINGTFYFESTLELMKDLCDGFSITGFLLISFGLLLLIGNDGTFSMLSYAVKKMFSVFKKDSNLGTFYEYKKNRVENPAPFKHFLIVGSIFMAIGIIFLIMFLSIYPN